MSDESALLAAIIAHADEDTPRLAYADWLDEHDAPIQAEFIRVQCKLATCSAADPDYPDLLERYEELVPQFRRIVKSTMPELPPGFHVEDDLRLDYGEFRRGFLDTVHREGHSPWMGAPNVEDSVLEELCEGLPQLIATTTARSLYLTNMSSEQVARLLSTPGAESLTGLSIAVSTGGAGADAAMVQAIGRANVPQLERLRLDLYSFTSIATLAPLARAKFDKLVHIDLPALHGPVRGIRTLTTAKWFRELRSVNVYVSDQPLESSLIATLAKLPHLESLDLRAHSTEAKGLTHGFPSLARLKIGFRSKTGVNFLAKGTFPRLTELEFNHLESSKLAAISKAPWFPQLRVLSLPYGDLNATGVALSKSPVAANLRILRLKNVSLNRKTLAALGDGSRFPNLTTLTITLNATTKKQAAEMVRFVKSLTLPRIRHLRLECWHFGEAGAKALASNPSLANLTILELNNCEINDAGLSALARSPHLQQLIVLDMPGNKLEKATALHNPKWLPRLASLWLLPSGMSWAAYQRVLKIRGFKV